MDTILSVPQLSLLPPPEIIDSPLFSEIYEEMKVQFLALDPNYTLLLESDPIVKFLQTVAYRELVWRERVNEAFKGTFLAYAIGATLDHKAAEQGLTRLAGETDDRLRHRIQLRRSSFANAGGAAHYRFFALSADARVKDVAVYSPDFPGGVNMGGKVIIAVLAEGGNPVPSQDILDRVELVISRKDVRMLNDMVQVLPATQKPFSIFASVKLFPNYAYSRLAELKATLQAAFEQKRGLGADITRSWISSVLHAEGIHSVEVVTPSADFVIAPNEYPELTEITLAFSGYSDAEGYGVIETDEEKTLREAHISYRKFVIAGRRTISQITSDLVEKPKPGVIQPTIRSFAEFLNLAGIKDDQGAYLPKDEIAFLIHRELSPLYAPTEV